MDGGPEGTHAFCDLLKAELTSLLCCGNPTAHYCDHYHESMMQNSAETTRYFLLSELEGRSFVNLSITLNINNNDYFMLLILSYVT